MAGKKAGKAGMPMKKGMPGKAPMGPGMMESGGHMMPEMHESMNKRESMTRLKKGKK